MRLFTGLIVAALGAGSAFGIAVDVPTDDVTVNLALLLQAGHYYKWYDAGDYHLGSGDFSIDEGELRVSGTVLGRAAYDVRASRFDSLREAFVGAEILPHFSARVGRLFEPFGVEATTYEGFWTCDSQTITTQLTAPRRNDGVRLDYGVQRETWPYEFGVGAGVFDDANSLTLVEGAGRIYGTPFPGLKYLTAGFSYLYDKALRWKYRPDERPEEHFLEEPSVGGDISFDVWRITFGAEYMQHFLNDYPIEGPGYSHEDIVYKDTYNRGYFGTLGYTQPQPWRHFQDFNPYFRYERWKPAVVARGDIALDLYTAGFAFHFLGRNLMFRSEYTRILEDEYRTANDRTASEFQVML